MMKVASLPVKTIVVFMTPSSLLTKGYYLFMDNWFSGFRLYQYKKFKGTVCCGTLREDIAPAEVRELEGRGKDPMKALR
ncbi:hypothetical protein ACOMHN_033043 [Nucella lapillus]